MNETIQTDITIVGAGPTGLALACQLIRYGVDFVIFDQKEGITDLSKAIAVQARTLEIYEQLGLAERAVEAGAIARGVNVVADGEIRGSIDLSDIGKNLSPYPFALLLEQSKNERLLYDYLQQSGKNVLWQTALETVSQTDTEATAIVKNANGETQTITAKYLVGCDGAKSLVRHGLNFAFEGNTIALGVDDFAFRRGERSGAILVDLEKRKPIDLLPDREAATLAQWLKKHPEIEIISRDRAGCYATGAKVAAPQAVQVADRFHLLKNLLDGFERFLSRQHQVIGEVFQKAFPSKRRSPKEQLPNTNPLLSAAKTLEIEQKAARTATREKRFWSVKELHQIGTPILARSAPFEDESEHGQKVFGGRVGITTPTELPEIFAASTASALFTETMDTGRRTKQPTTVERNQSARLSESGSHLASFSAKMA